jgi:hypothetical protein
MSTDLPAAVLVRHRVASARELVGAALDVLALAEIVAPDSTTRELVRLAEADCTALAGRLVALAHRLEHPRTPEAA